MTLEEDEMSDQRHDLVFRTRVLLSGCFRTLLGLGGLATIALTTVMLLGATVVAESSEAKPTAARPVFTPNGRLCYDLAFFNENKNRLDNGSMLRSGRVGVRMKFLSDWSAALDISFNDGKLAVDDAWGQYHFSEFDVRAGNFKEPLGMESLASLLQLPFPERALPFALCSFRKMGVAVARFQPLYSLSAGVFGGNVSRSEGEPGLAVTGRATFAPEIDEVTRVHLGLGFSRRTADTDTSGLRSISFKSRPETRVDGTNFLSTGKIGDVDYSVTVQFETALRWQGTCLQGEYWVTRVKRSAGVAEPTFEGGYVAADVVLFGEQRKYLESSATFGGVSTESKHGALELAVRYSWLDLNDLDAAITGGREQEFTIGLNWYLNKYVRWMTDLAFVNNDRHADGAGTLLPDDDYTFVQCRLQMSY